MLTFALPYGHRQLEAALPEADIIDVLKPRRDGFPRDEARLLHAALDNPIGTPRLRDLVRPGQRVVIVTSDLTRPCPSARLLPLLLDELQAAGLRDADLSVVMALGLHRPMTAAEMEAAVGSEVYRRVRVLNHDQSDVVRLGVTSRGTPVEIYRLVAEADARICLGNLELHYFAGFSGGAKAILPGCASRATVTANHAMMVRPEAANGRLEGNPVRLDLEEGVAMLGVDFILNVAVDSGHRIQEAVAGDVIAAHREGSARLVERCMAPIPEPADVVLVSAGGYPKDVNLYQAHKALVNAARAVKQGGVIILAAECIEGFGNTTFETWVREAVSIDELVERIQREFVMGGHKAAAIASLLKRASVYLVSAMPDEAVIKCGLVPFGGVEAAMAAAREQAGPAARWLVMPEGVAMLPVLEEI